MSDADTKGMDQAGLFEDLGQVKATDVVVLIGCCHNPSGVDPDQAVWKQIAASAKAKVGCRW